MALKTWTTNYPTTIDTTIEQPTVVNSTDDVDASHVNSLSESLRALEVQVGSDLLEVGSLRTTVASQTASIATNTANLSALQVFADSMYSVQDSVTAHAGGGQESATIASGTFVNITVCATNLNSIILEDTDIGQTIIVRNAGAQECSAYLPVGHNFVGSAANVPMGISAGSVQKFIKVTSTSWTIINRGLRYVHRNVEVADWTIGGGITDDGTWRYLDASSILPPTITATHVGFVGAGINGTKNTYGSITASGIASLRGIEHRVSQTNYYEWPSNPFITVGTNRRSYTYNAPAALTAFSPAILGWWVVG